MATLIDSLVIKLGLDVADLQTKSREVQDAMKRTSEQVERRGVQMEEAGKRVTEGFRKLREEAIAMLALFLGAEGLRSFIRETTRAEVETGKLARNIGISVTELDAWGKASERLGGNAEATKQSLMNIGQALESLRTTGQGNEITQRLSSLGIGFTDPVTGKPLDPSAIMEQLARKMQGLRRPEAYNILAGMGLDKGTIDLVLEGVEELNRKLADARRVAMTPEDVRAAQALTEAFNGVSQQVTKLARDLFTELSPALTKILGFMNEWLEANREWLKQQIEEKVGEFVRWIQSVDWTAILAGIEGLWRQVNDLVEKFGGWQTVIETIIALKLASWILDLVSPITSVLALLMSLNPAFAAFMAAAAVIGGAGYAAYKTGEKTGKAADLGFRPSGMPGSIDEFGNVSMWTNPKTGETITADEMDKRLKEYNAKGGAAAAPSTGKVSENLGLSSDEYDKFRGSIAKIESGGRYDIMGGSSGRFAGKYQMGQQEIEETARRLGEAVPSRSQFLADPSMQERFFEAYTLGHHDTLMRNPKYAAMSPQEKASVLAYAHNQGAGGASKWLDTGQVGSDAFHTPGTAYSGAVAAALRAPSGPDKSLLAGAKPAATRAGGTTTTTTNTSSVDTNINGPIQIHTAATDADGIAKGIGASLRKYAVVGQANYGLA